MNPKSKFIKRLDAQPFANQRGGILIESLIGMLLLGIVGGGIMHSTARMTVVQHDMAVHTVVINQMRNILMSGVTPAAGNACAAAPSISVPGTTQLKTVTVSGCAPVLMTISGVTVGGSVLGAQNINTASPLVFELGEDDDLVRIGGKVNQANDI